MKELVKILSGTVWTWKKWTVAIIAMIAMVLLISESDSLAWLFGSKVVGIVIVLACVWLSRLWGVTFSEDDEL